MQKFYEILLEIHDCKFNLQIEAFLHEKASLRKILKKETFLIKVKKLLFGRRQRMFCCLQRKRSFFLNKSCYFVTRLYLENIVMKP